MRPASSILIIAPLAITAAFVTTWVSVDRREAALDHEHARWRPARSVDRLVMIDLETLKADQGRYPDTLTLAQLGKRGDLWFYQANSTGSDYELWTRIPRERPGDESGFDALVFSPDSLIGADWPGARPTPGGVWTIVERADLAPPERWRSPVNP